MQKGSWNNKRWFTSAQTTCCYYDCCWWCIEWVHLFDKSVFNWKEQTYGKPIWCYCVWTDGLLKSRLFWAQKADYLCFLLLYTSTIRIIYGTFGNADEEKSFPVYFQRMVTFIFTFMGNSDSLLARGGDSICFSQCESNIEKAVFVLTFCSWWLQGFCNIQCNKKAIWSISFCIKNHPLQHVCRKPVFDSGVVFYGNLDYAVNWYSKKDSSFFLKNTQSSLLKLFPNEMWRII